MRRIAPMSGPRTRFAVGVCLLLFSALSARTAHAEQVISIVGEVETLWGPFTPCGHHHVIGEVDVFARQVETGALSDPRIVVEASCPPRWTVHELLRFELATHRPSEWPRISSRSRRAHRYYLIRTTSLESR